MAPHAALAVPVYLSKGTGYSLLALLVCLLLASGCGGCPWTQASQVSTSPDRPCLELRIHNKEGDTHPGGCVDPHLVGSNNCQETLDISISKLSISQTYSFAPGEQVDVLVALEVADNQGDRYSFNLPATLGEQAITISFHTWRQDP